MTFQKTKITLAEGGERMEDPERGLKTFLKALGIEQDRAMELYDKVLEAAAKHGTPGFVVEKPKELIAMAESEEEIFLVAFLATMLADSLAYAANPAPFAIMAAEAVQNVAIKMEELKLSN